MDAFYKYNKIIFINKYNNLKYAQNFNSFFKCFITLLFLMNLLVLF